MTCFKPILMQRVGFVNKSTGEIDFSSPSVLGSAYDPKYSNYVNMIGQTVNGSVDGQVLSFFTVPCGQCVGCRISRTRDWAVRCVHEASLYDDNCFITLTYADQFLHNVTCDNDLYPLATLVMSDFQKFMKRLRKRFTGHRIRFYGCGEYGAKRERPHFHSILFNFDFPDKELYYIKDNHRFYRSKILEELWPFGISVISDVNYEVAAYVARYCLKKVNGDLEDEHYRGRTPEFVLCSRRPGIAHDWLEMYSSDVYNHDYVVIRDGIKLRPPRYYDKIFDVDHHDVLELLKVKRVAECKPLDLSRLSQREQVRLSILKNLKRDQI